MPFTIADDQKADLACTCAALILSDSNTAVTAENISAILEAAGFTDFEAYYPKLFASALEGKDLGAVIFGGASGAGSSSSSSSGSSSSGSDSSSDSSSDSD